MEQLNDYVSQASRYYNSLFRLPSYFKIIVLLISINVFFSIFTFWIAKNNALEGFIFGFFILTIPTVTSDVVIRLFFTKKDLIFNLRRGSALSLFSCIFILVIVFIGGLIQRMFSIPSLIYSSIYSIPIVISLRYLIYSVSFLDSVQIFFSSITQPITYLVTLLFFWNLWSYKILFIILVSTLLFFIYTHFFITLLNNRGKRVLDLETLSLLRAFAVNWIEGVRAPLEDLLDHIGADMSVKVSMLAFGRENKINSMIVVPDFHPGPFKNLGSSNMPYTIQKMLEDRLGIIAGVPHGTSGHEMDLTSEKQCDKVIKGILNIAERLKNCYTKATKIVRKRVESAEATCQIMGECAFITLTLSPYGMEDIPRKVGIRIVEKGLSMGLKNVVVVDSHNSIGKIGEKASLSKQDLKYLESAAAEALKSALSESYEPYKIGVARNVPSEFNLDDGIGLGGIIAFTFMIGDYKNFYVVIDGNNMVKGLREKIIMAIKKLGFDDGEVITTDTHLMSAMPLTMRGYYPVGEAISHQLFISYIKDTVIEANNEMSKSDFSCEVAEFKKVRVIGEKSLLNLSLLIDSTMKYVRTLVPLIFIPASIISLIPFLFL